jgi:phosphoglycolate phosphatase
MKATRLELTDCSRSVGYGARVIRDILFDLDGTLTDSADGITRCLVHAIVSLDATPPARQQLEAHIGTPLRDIFAAVLETDDDARLNLAIRLYAERFQQVGFSENRLYDGILETLAALVARGYRLHIATAKRQSDAFRVAEHFDIAGSFEGIYGVLNEVERRDKARLIERILSNGGIEAQHGAMVGDRYHDMEGAQRNGLLAVGAGWGYGSDDELKAAGANWICPDPRALLDQFPAL